VPRRSRLWQIRDFFSDDEPMAIGSDLLLVLVLLALLATAADYLIRLWSMTHKGRLGAKAERPL
jgi:hypothetical protein